MASRFEDGSVEQIDVIVSCTGYKVTFPFFDEGFISAPDNDLPLYKRVRKPDIANLACIALLQPPEATMPLAEEQGAGAPLDRCVPPRRVQLPSRAEIEADTRRERERTFNRYVASNRHTMHVDFDNYRFDIGKELKAGSELAPGRGIPAAGHTASAGGASAGGRMSGAALDTINGKRARTKAQNHAAILDAAR